MVRPEVPTTVIMVTTARKTVDGSAEIPAAAMAGVEETAVAVIEGRD